jgi:hypothetical protein
MHVHSEIFIIASNVGLMLGKPAFDHFFEKFAERGIHYLVHHHARLGGAAKRFKLFPDAVMVCLLIGLDLVVKSLGGG